MENPPDEKVVELTGVSVKRSGKLLLDQVDWTIRSGEHWVVFGANGSGKTTLLQVVSSYQFPYRGTVTVLGETLGRTDVRSLRPRIGYVGPEPTKLIREYLPCRKIVVTGRHASFLDTRWHTYTEDDWASADKHLETMDAAQFSDREFITLSEGEKKRVLIARALMTDPELLLLDESASGLDLGSRERLMSTLSTFAIDSKTPPIVLVTHHVEEIPVGFDNVLFLSGGRVTACGSIEQVLTSEALSDGFGLPLQVSRVDDRYRAWGA